MKLAERIHHPIFQRFVSCLSHQTQDINNLIRFTAFEWERDRLILDSIPALSKETRRQGLVRHRLRFLVIRAAEVAILAHELKFAEFSNLLHDLMQWAWKVAQHCSEVETKSESLLDEQPNRAHLIEVRKILKRWTKDHSAKLLTLFEDPLVSPQSLLT